MDFYHSLSCWCSHHLVSWVSLQYVDLSLSDGTCVSLFHSLELEKSSHIFVASLFLQGMFTQLEVHKSFWDVKIFKIHFKFFYNMSDSLCSIMLLKGWLVSYCICCDHYQWGICIGDFNNFFPNPGILTFSFDHPCVLFDHFVFFSPLLSSFLWWMWCISFLLWDLLFLQESDYKVLPLEQRRLLNHWLQVMFLNLSCDL